MQPKPKVRIVYLLYADFPYGRGPARYIHMLGKELVAHGQQVSVILPYAFRPGPKVQEIDGIKVQWCYVPQTPPVSGRADIGLKGHLLSRVLFVLKLFVMSFRREYDWLILYSVNIETIIVAIAARLTGRKVASHYADLPWRQSRPTLRDRIRYWSTSRAEIWGARLSTLVFPISTYFERRLEQIAPHTPRLLLPASVDTVLFGSGDGSKYRTRPELAGHKLVVYAGTFWVVEGLANLVAAMAQVTRRIPDARLVIAGGASVADSDDVEALAAQHGIRDKTVLLGQLDLADVVDLLAAADVLVVSKINHLANRVAMPIKIVEYLSAGKPIVASNIGDIGYYLRDREHAILVEPGDVQALADGICEVLQDAELAEHLAKQGQQLARDTFDALSVTARMLAGMEAIGKQA